MSRLGTDLRLGWEIARAEYVRRWRRLRGDRRRLAALVLLLLFQLPMGLFLLQWLHGVGQGSRTGLGYPVVAAARNLIGPFLVTVTAMGALSGAQELGKDTGESLLLRTVSNRAHLLGDLLADLLGSIGLYLTGIGVMALAFTLGAGTPLATLSVLGAMLPLVTLGFLVGYALAYAYWLGLLSLPISVGARQVVGALTSVVLFLVFFGGGMALGGGAAEDQLASAVPTGPPPTPLGWYADLFVVGTPLATPLGIRTLVAATLVVGAIPCVTWVLTRLAPRFWYAVPTKPDADTDSVTASQPASVTIGRDGWLGRSRTLRLAVGYGRRLVRRPDRAIYLFYYLLFATVIGLPGVLPGGDTPVAVTGFALVLLGGWLAGGVFCLNPLGDEGGMLSQVLLSETPARTIIAARLLAGITVGLPIAGVGAVVVATSTPGVGTRSAVVLGLLVIGLVGASAGLALAVGAAIPQFETDRLFGSVEAVTPSTIAGLFHGGVTLVVTGGAVGLPVVAIGTDLLPAWGRVAVIGATMVVLLGLADGGRRYATAALDAHGRTATPTGPLLAVYTAAGLALLSFVVAQVVTVAVFMLDIGGLSPQHRLVVLFLTQYAGFAAVGLGFLYTSRRGLAFLDRSVSVRDGGWVVGGLAGGLGVWWLSTTAISRFGLPAADQETIQAASADPSLLLVLVVLVLLVNAPVEELLYRNVIQKTLRESVGTTSAILVTSVLFALAHVPAYFDPDPLALGVPLALLFVLSVLWGVVYEKTGSLVATSAVHGLYNATLIGLAYASIAGLL